MAKLGREAARGWAREEFGFADLGDLRRNRRLVELAEAAANRPGGAVTTVFKKGAAREAAFRFLENKAVDPVEVGRAASLACARRVAARGGEFAFVPVDGSSLKITDEAGAKGLGVVGSRKKGALGLEVMSAIAVAADGTPLGLCGQSYWARGEAVPGSQRHKRNRKPTAKETKYWLEVMDQVRAVFSSEAAGVRPWYQLDRGADAWPVLLQGLEANELFTVRAAQDRRLTLRKGETKRRYLWRAMEKLAVGAVKELPIPALPARPARHGKARPARRARTAKIELRWGRVSLDLVTHNKKCRQAPLFALLACETRKSARKEEPIEWLLLTSRPIRSRADAELVLNGYSQRWRIEQFHKTWKTDGCNIEDTQLRSRDNIIRWATVLASVAMRAVRLQYLARNTPEVPATLELTRGEIDAVILLYEAPTKGPRAGKKPKLGSVPTMGEIVELLAYLGGYTGKSSGGPPGARVITRGLENISALAMALDLGVVTPAKK